MNNINLVDLLMLMLFAVTMGSLIASSMIRSRRRKGYGPIGPSIRTRPPMDRKNLLKIVIKKEVAGND